MVGRSTAGIDAMGSLKKHRAPNNKIPNASRKVAIGRRMKGVENVMTVRSPFSALRQLKRD